MEATRLERIRIAQGLSRPKLARMAEVSESTIIRIERNHGYDPGVFLMRRIAASLDVAVDDLLEPAPTTGGGE